MRNWAIGIDLVEIERFRNFPPSNHPRFYKRIFSEEEQAYCNQFNDPFPHYAGIFAAKEAVLKGLSYFTSLTISFLSNIVIMHDKNNRPLVTINYTNNIILNKIFHAKLTENSPQLDLSVTHTQEIACAWVMIHLNPRSPNITPEISIPIKQITKKVQQVIGKIK